MVCIEIPRCDTNEGVEGGAIELTVTSELQAHLSWPRAGLANHLSAQGSVTGSGLRARQTKGSAHAPEIPTPTPAVNIRFDINCLARGLEGKCGLSVSKEE